MENTNVIYCYIKKDTQEVVYVGQTVNLNTRRLKHEKYDPFNPNYKEYYYPLSRGIRKYGVDYYECKILEKDIKSEDLDEREKYWIQYYNTYLDNTKYNLTPGGSPSQYKFTYFPDNVVQLATDLIKNTTISFQEISETTGISVVMLSEINHGKRRKQDNETYPLRELTQGKQLTATQINEIINILKYDFISNKDIAKKFNVSPTLIQFINNGSRNYHYDNIDYPIRKESYANNHLTRQDVEEIYDLILNTSWSFKKIAEYKKCNNKTIAKINNGDKYILEGFNFPLRSI